MSVVITGASRGIGSAIAEQLAAGGEDVAFCYRSDEGAAARTEAQAILAAEPGHAGAKELLGNLPPP